MTLDLVNWLKQFSSGLRPLRWCHSTLADRFVDMVKGGAIQVAHCNHFKAGRVYFFYGRPAFRLIERDSARSIKGPVVLLLKPLLSLHGAARLFPFDTGAFLTDRFQAWIPAGTNVKDFELDTGGSAPSQVVEAFFDTNEKYMSAQVSASALPADAPSVATLLRSMYEDDDTSSADDRSNALELQTDQDVPLRSALVEAIVLPDELLANPSVSSFFASTGNAIKTIEIKNRKKHRAIEFQTEIESEVERWYRAQGLL